MDTCSDTLIIRTRVIAGEKAYSRLSIEKPSRTTEGLFHAGCHRRWFSTRSPGVRMYRYET